LTLYKSQATVFTEEFIFEGVLAVQAIKVIFIIIFPFILSASGYAQSLKVVDQSETPEKSESQQIENTKKPATKKVKRRRRILKNLYAVLKTSIDGEKLDPIKIKLHYRFAKKNVENFVALAEGKREYSYQARKFKDTPYYDGNKFHIVMKNFIIQTGDPTGTGAGDPGYFVEDEIHPALKHDKPGVVAMAKVGKNKNNSQFYITLSPQKSLDKRYTIIGQVVQGMESVKKIGNVKTNLATNKPLVPVILEKVTIEREFK
jgi:peptidyl-prolyl cis-trans isomerase A (cyclophilin A)